MYANHFGLAEKPFSIAPDPRYLFMSERHREALAHLRYGLQERGGFVQLTGEVGTGKTLITRALVETLPEDVDLALVLNPSVSVSEFLQVICTELQIRLPGHADSTQSLISALNEYLLEAYARGRRTVILIDEAHCLSERVVEQVRLLTNLETTREKLLQIILVGQPELIDMLNRRELRQVAQRITARYHLTPLKTAETCNYIRHRCAIAGSNRSLFSKLAQLLIHRRAQGTPRLINIISDRALLGAYAHQRRHVGLYTAWRAAREVEGATGVRWRAAVLMSAMMLALTLALIPRLPAPVPDVAPGIASVDAVSSAAKGPDEESPQLVEDLGVWLNGIEDTQLTGAASALFEVWGVSRQVTAEPEICQLAVDAGLRCFRERGDWERLRLTNLPAVLELVDGSGRTHSVLLRRLDHKQAALEAGGELSSFSLTALERYWNGRYLLLWRPPAIGRELLMPGSRGLGVDWLATRLDRIEGRTPEQYDNILYDEALQQRVRAFQRAQHLRADGIVGEHTLIHLMTALPEQGAPGLH